MLPALWELIEISDGGRLSSDENTDSGILISDVDDIVDGGRVNSEDVAESRRSGVMKPVMPIEEVDGIFPEIMACIRSCLSRASYKSSNKQVLSSPKIHLF